MAEKDISVAWHATAVEDVLDQLKSDRQGLQQRDAEQRLNTNDIVLLSITTVMALQMLFTYAPVMQSLFGSAPLALADWAVVALLGALFVTVEAEKWLSRRRESS